MTFLAGHLEANSRFTSHSKKCPPPPPAYIDARKVSSSSVVVVVVVVMFAHWTGSETQSGSIAEVLSGGSGFPIT